MMNEIKIKLSEITLFFSDYLFNSGPLIKKGTSRKPKTIQTTSQESS